MAGRYPGGALATMTASMTSYSSRTAAIATDRGRIDFDDFHHPTKAVFTPYVEGPGSWVVEPGAPVEVLGEEPVIGQGYGNEIAEVGRCLRAGLRESPLVPHEQTLTLLRQMDDVRRRSASPSPADSPPATDQLVSCSHGESYGDDTAASGGSPWVHHLAW